MDIEIVLTTKKDILDLASLRTMLQKEDWEEDYIISDEDSRRTTINFLEENLNKDFFIFAAKVNDVIIATCGIQIIYYMPQVNNLSGKVGYICDVFTCLEYRFKGVQRTLLKEVIKFAMQKEIKILQLLTDNDIAISLYESLGFKHNNNAMICNTDF
ncbi:MAG: GNAT family N-acetyltransferase [Bacilli bacterium]